MAMRNFILIGFLFLFINETYATTYYTRSTGNITGNIWGTTTTGTGGALPVLVNGDIIVIDDNITITTNFTDWNSAVITINLYAIIDFDKGQLDLHLNSIIDFKTSSAKVISSSPGNGANDKIRFGNGPAQWDSQDPDVTGPGIMDKNFNGGGPLPVELLFFKAIQSSENVFLSWASASEKNFDYFSIERSANGMDFSEIEQVKGHGTTIERKDYKLVDNSPLIGRNYYRLKSVDFDGYTEYFNVVLVNFSGEKTFSVFPNPSDGTAVNFALNFVPDGHTTITVFDNYNSNIAMIKPTDHWQSVTFANSLKSGLYFARIVSKDFVRVERFVVK